MPPEEGELPTDPGASFRLFEIISGPSGSALREVILANDKKPGL
jgi:hypothetical protein